MEINNYLFKYILYMENGNKGDKGIIIINNGNKNKSHFQYVNKVTNALIANNGNALLKAYSNNMNKLITIVEIIKRQINNSCNITYSIGKDNFKNKLTEYIQAHISVDINNGDNIAQLKQILSYEKSSQMNNICVNTKEEDDNDIDNDIINNISNYFN
jgi:hypothetical protein